MINILEKLEKDEKAIKEIFGLNGVEEQLATKEAEQSERFYTDPTDYENDRDNELAFE